MNRYAYDSSDETLIAKLRIPLNGKRASILAALVVEHPDHALHIEGPFLVMHLANNHQ